LKWYEDETLNTHLRPPVSPAARCQLFALTGYFALFIIAMADYSAHPQLWDAGEYIKVAQNFVEKGYGSEIAPNRSIGYPTLLYLLALFGLPLPASAILIQGLLYGAVSLWLARLVALYNEHFSAAILFGLLLNPLNVWALNATLSEAPTLIIFIGLTALLIRARESRLSLILLGSAFAAYAILIRPANTVLFIAWSTAATCLVLRATVPRSQKMLMGVSAIILAALALGPQIFLNLSRYNSFSIFPRAKLFDFQLKVGTNLAKYGTSGDPAAYGPLYYFNPLKTVGGPPLDWYLSHPMAGLGTMALHVFNSFSFDYHSVYVYDVTPALPWLFPFLIWILVVAGIVTIIGHASQIPMLFPPVIFVGLVFLGTVMQNSIVAVENRFNLMPMTVLFVGAFFGAYKLADLKPRVRVLMVALVIGSSALLTVGTELMKMTAPAIVRAQG
jgi:hypothetical protein